jgi:hypothetical protein
MMPVFCPTARPTKRPSSVRLSSDEGGQKGPTDQGTGSAAIAANRCTLTYYHRDILGPLRRC